MNRPTKLLLAALVGVPTMLAALPVGPLPSLPQLPLPVDVGKTVSGVTERVGNVRPLTELRRLRVRDLLRTRRTVLEADPAGAPMVRHEVLSFSPADSALEQARAAGFSVARERVLAGLEARIMVLRAPSGMSTRRALQKLRALDPAGEYDFNHIYTESGEATLRHPGASRGPVERALPELDPGLRRDDGGPGPPIKIGLVDGGIDVTHPVFEKVVVHQYGCGDKPVPSAHGTAVASLIAGQAGKFQGAAAGAELYAADIYCDRPTGGAMDDIADGIAWIARHEVPVINVSLVGPRNVMLEKVVRLASARGHVIVAAVGNDGPAARPLYPSAYPDVVGVTGVDSKQRVLLEAVRGRQVDFAAPGSDMAAAVMEHGYAPVRGTSFAAPIVASLLATQLHNLEKGAAQQAVVGLMQLAVDLGTSGPDEIYGNGLVGGSFRIDPALAGPVVNK